MALPTITHARTRQKFLAGRPRNFRHAPVCALPILLAFFILPACSSAPAETAAETPREDLSPWYSGKRPARAPAPIQRADSDAGGPVVLGDLDPNLVDSTNPRSDTADLWSIVIAAFKGDNAEALAQQALARAQLAGLEAAYNDRRDSTWVVAFGGYKEPGAPEAQADLAAVRALEFDGKRPFESAMLAPPSAVRSGSLPDYDLSLVRKRAGGNRAKYTLQIAQYCRTDQVAPSDAELAEFRKAAEEACVRLRREGEEAFFHHGPRMSSVTIGLFTEADYQTTTPRSKEVGAIVISRKPVESEPLRAARERHPYNLINGQAARVRSRPGAEARMVPSTIVAVPE